jgi:hypothetical protein
VEAALADRPAPMCGCGDHTELCEKCGKCLLACCECDEKSAAKVGAPAPSSEAVEERSMGGVRGQLHLAINKLHFMDSQGDGPLIYRREVHEAIDRTLAATEETPLLLDGVAMVRELYEHFQGPHACGDFTCSCGNCGLCDFRKKVETWLAARREPGPGDETEFQRGVRTLADLIRCHYPSFNEHKIHEMFDVLIPPTGVAGPGDRAMAGARECCSKYSTKQGHDYTCDLPHGHTGIHMARKYGGYIAESWTDTEAAAIERSQTPQGVPK